MLSAVLADWKIPVLALTVAVLWLAESVAPQFADFVKTTRARTVHGLRNASFGLINGVLSVFALGVIIAYSVSLANINQFGLLRWLPVSGVFQAMIALILFDAWSYWWHRFNHIVPFLWYFHRIHHSDTKMDVTTALRFHPGEILLSTVARLAVVNLIGMELWHLALYEIIALPIVAFHHSNIAMPRGIDRPLRWMIVTPWMHWVHHSHLIRESNSNYSSVLSVWDRIFGSYQIHPQPSSIVFGIDGDKDIRSPQPTSPTLHNPLPKNSAQ